MRKTFVQAGLAMLVMIYMNQLGSMSAAQDRGSARQATPPPPAPGDPGVNDNKPRTEEEPGDASKGEVSRTKMYIGKTLRQITTRLKDNKVRVEEFRENGTRSGIVEAIGSGLRTTQFTNDGQGLQRVILLEGNPAIGMTTTTSEYRSDGKTLWTETKEARGTRQIKYYGKDGKLRLTRTFKKNGEMEVIAVDATGAEQYRQLWLSGFGGYTLVQVTERLPNGGERRVYLKGRKPWKAEYYKSDGSLEKTEPGDKLTSPFDQSRATEVAPDDDPSIPNRARSSR